MVNLFRAKGGDSTWFGNSPAAVIFRNEFFGIIAAIGEGLVAFWNGSAWVPKSVKYWTGSAWVVKPMKRWSGTAWL